MLLQPAPIEVKAFLDNSIGLKDWITWGMGALTLGLLAWYTWKTHQMQSAVNKQAEAMNAQLEASRQQITVMQQQTAELIHQRQLSIMPSLTTEIVEFETSDIDRSMYEIVFTNVGNGAALAIEVDPVLFPLDAPLTGDIEENIRHDLENQHVTFEVINVLIKGAAKCANHRYLLGEDYTGMDSFFRLLGGTYDLRVRFQDIEGNCYEQIITAGMGICMPGPVKRIPTE